VLPGAEAPAAPGASAPMRIRPRGGGAPAPVPNPRAPSPPFTVRTGGVAAGCSRCERKIRTMTTLRRAGDALVLYHLPAHDQLHGQARRPRGAPSRASRAGASGEGASGNTLRRREASRGFVRRRGAVCSAPVGNCAPRGGRRPRVLRGAFEVQAAAQADERATWSAEAGRAGMATLAMVRSPKPPSALHRRWREDPSSLLLCCDL